MIIEDYTTEFDGHRLLLRPAALDDAETLIAYLKRIYSETRFLSSEPEEVELTVEEERDFINKQNESETNLMLMGFLDGEYVGNCSLSRSPLSRYRHRARLGIALFQKYTGLGIGKRMIEFLFMTAKEKGLEQIELEVVSENERAFALYEKMGFTVLGKFPENMKYKDGTYADAYLMLKKL